MDEQQRQDTPELPRVRVVYLFHYPPKPPPLTLRQWGLVGWRLILVLLVIAGSWGVVIGAAYLTYLGLRSV